MSTKALSGAAKAAADKKLARMEKEEDEAPLAPAVVEKKRKAKKTEVTKEQLDKLNDIMAKDEVSTPEEAQSAIDEANAVQEAKMKGKPTLVVDDSSSDEDDAPRPTSKARGSKETSVEETPAKKAKIVDDEAPILTAKTAADVDDDA